MSDEIDLAKKAEFLEFCALGQKAASVGVDDVRLLIEGARFIFRAALRNQKRPEKQITALLTKFTDAGRRSPPTAVFSKILPGRPQSGSDGNRTRRWLLADSHKFYAAEIPATLVEVKYLLQTLSMANAPALPKQVWTPYKWLTGHEIRPGHYLDPLQLVPIDLDQFCDNPRLVQSGHIFPLDRGGAHVPENAFLMLARSNQLQGNNTVPEMLQLMKAIVERHKEVPPELAAIFAKQKSIKT